MEEMKQVVYVQVDVRKLQPKVDVEEHVVDHGWSPEKDPKLRHEGPAAGPDPALQHANAQARRCAWFRARLNNCFDRFMGVKIVSTTFLIEQPPVCGAVP